MNEKKQTTSIIEVGPRDGFQNLRSYLLTDRKIYYIEQSIAAGLKHLQTISFVNPKAIPQMEDAATIADTIVERHPNLDLSALVLNLREAQGAREAGLCRISIVTFLSKSHNMANVNKTHDQSFEGLREIAENLNDIGVVLDIATAFSRPFEGKQRSASAMVELCERTYDMGARTLNLCNTVGQSDPAQVVTFTCMTKGVLPGARLESCIHDTRGTGTARPLEGWKVEADGTRSALGGLGGCPFASGASGSTATEDLVSMLEEMGIDTGISFRDILALAKEEHSEVQGNYSGVNLLVKNTIYDLIPLLRKSWYSLLVSLRLWEGCAINITLISLAVLIVAILTGFFHKMSVGLIAILAITILAGFISTASKDVIEGFSSGLFIVLLGVSFLCAVGITNGSLGLLAKKVLRLSRGHVFIAPIVLYLIGYGAVVIDPGYVPALGIATVLSLPSTKIAGYSSTMLTIIGEMGFFAGRFSPIAPESTPIRELAVPQGIQGHEIDVLMYATITTIVLALAAHFWFKREKKSEVVAERESIPHFSSGQLLALTSFTVLIIGSAFFRRSVGPLTFVTGTFLILVGAVDEERVFQAISWPVLLMVTGFSMLTSIVISVGDVELLLSALASVMASKTATAIQGSIAGITSWFSSATGVVWLTMVPTVESVTTNVGVSPAGSISTICLTISFAGLGPAFTGGRLIMATASSDPDFDKGEESKLFLTLFAILAVCLFLLVLAAPLGLYSILG